MLFQVYTQITSANIPLVKAYDVAKLRNKGLGNTFCLIGERNYEGILQRVWLQREMKDWPINVLSTTVRGLSGNHGLSYPGNHINTVSDSRYFKDRMSHKCPVSSFTIPWAETLTQIVTYFKNRETRNINLMSKN